MQNRGRGVASGVCGSVDILNLVYMFYRSIVVGTVLTLLSKITEVFPFKC